MARGGAEHWIVAAARAGGIPGAGRLDVPADATPEDAWSRAADTTGATEERLAACAADHLGLGVAKLERASPTARRILPAWAAWQHGVLPLRYTDRVLVAATSDPPSPERLEDLERVAGRAVQVEIAGPTALRAALERTYPGEEEAVLRPRQGQAKRTRRILVVDDEAEIRVLLRAVLEREGFEVAVAADGPEALRMLASEGPFDAVTLDLKMVPMDGLEVLRRIRSKLASATLPVVVATGTEDPEVQQELFQAGASDYVVKPVDPPRFVLRLRAVLRRRTS